MLITFVLIVCDQVPMLIVSIEKVDDLTAGTT